MQNKQTPSELRQMAFDAFTETDVPLKMQKTRLLFESTKPLNINPKNTIAPDMDPSWPEQPVLMSPLKVDKRSPFTQEGHCALVHAICHIEFNAVHLALDAIWRFSNMPDAYYQDWAKVAKEEAQHFEMLQRHLHDWGSHYGAFPAHKGLWEMCTKTKHDVTARMALVPRTLEARGLDATPLIQAKLQKSNTPYAQAVLEILAVILQDEIGHVAIGNHWFRWLCKQQGKDPMTHYFALHNQYNAPKLKPPFNTTARLAAGFTVAELAFLESQAPVNQV